MAELTDEERAARRNGLGASDAAGIFQMGYRTPFGVWADKVWGHEERVTPMMQRGHDLEPIIARKVLERGIVDELRPGGMVGHTDLDWMFATLDFEASWVVETWPVECKVDESRWHPDKWGPDDSGPDGVPPHYLLQVQQQIEVLGSEAAIVAVLLADLWEVRTYTVPADPKVAELLIEGGDYFWHQHVEARVPPPITDPDRDWDALKSIPLDVEREVDLPDTAAGLVREWRTARDDRKAAEAVEKECKAELARLMDGAGRGLIGGGHAVTLSEHTRKTGTVVRKLTDVESWSEDQ
jgi:putative phage-type endonuclease